MIPYSYQELLLEDHFADDAVDSLQRQLKHLWERDKAQSVIGLPVGEDVRPQSLLLDLPVVEIKGQYFIPKTTLALHMCIYTYKRAW